MVCYFFVILFVRCNYIYIFAIVVVVSDVACLILLFVVIVVSF